MHHQRADKVVAEFKEIIGESICAQISDANFQDLQSPMNFWQQLS
jgi:hypothetical protein